MFQSELLLKLSCPDYTVELSGTWVTAVDLSGAQSFSELTWIWNMYRTSLVYKELKKKKLSEHKNDPSFKNSKVINLKY